MPENKSQKILIVEDSQENVDLLLYFLRPQGYEILTAMDGEAGLTMVEEKRPDLILLDIMLPKLDGFSVCERIKGDRRTKFIPIIMITALKELKDKIRSLEVGADDFITKPFENIELLARVKSLLRLKAYHDELEDKNQQLARTNEALQQMDKFKEDLTNLIVHDMKNPLFVIQGNLQMMEMTMGSMSLENLKKYSNRIERGVQQLLRMVVNLLDISRIKDGTLTLKRDMADVNKLITNIVSRLREYPENANKAIQLKLDQELGEMIVDQSVMERVLENMVSFAANNVGDGGQVLIKSEKIDTDQIRLIIHDNGTQIPKKYQDKIFDEFSQVELKNKGYRVERALGLTFCKMAIDAHAGKMWLDTDNPVGNRFIIELKSLTRS
jgi:two-component system, sensor histidine kinase and response regulator